MIYKDGKKIAAVYFGSKVIQAIYCGAVLVWQAISSCFGAGRWMNTSAWSNTEGWKTE